MKGKILEIVENVQFIIYKHDLNLTIETDRNDHK